MRLMRCFGSKKTARLNVNVSVTHAFSKDIGGKIELTSNHDITCEWRQNSNTALLQLSHDRLTAFHVPPGEYTILCTSHSSSEVYTAQAVVEEFNIPSVHEYIITHSSSDFARDGKIQVLVKNLERDVSFLWTGGVITDEPVLNDVRPGIYSVTIISKRNRVPIPFYHICSPAKVEIENLAI